MAHSIDTDHSPVSFSRLPRDLRYLIWRFAIPDSRIVFLKKHAISRCEHAMVRVRSDLAVPDRCKDGARPGSSKILCTRMDDILPQDIKDLEEVRARIKHDGQCGFSSNAQIPNLLLVCRESYNFAIIKYHRAFPSVGAFAETYFDYQRDILLLLGEQIFCNVKSLTIVIEDYRSDDHENGIAESQRESELVFFDPVDIGESLRMLSSPVTKRSDLYGVLIPEHSSRNKLDLDKELLFDLQSEDEAKGLMWNMPKIRWTNLTTATFKRRFKKLLEEYELRTGVTCYRIAESDILYLYSEINR
ncbi:hypothetical protein BELL_0098g00030 [Botrytis elliptica]|uniref:2EXR domain-containing protein n=1 Tax=Botrytis elliptica TaxID=278938 RepID=A0A4Z1K8K4_9HELO|nr:hypothetical protein BELL_0098g00030 [Botrytis elliptica]